MNWSERFFCIVLMAEEMFTQGVVPPDDMTRLVDSFAMIDIVRFELFDLDTARQIA